MNCSACGATSLDGATFCQSCGQPMMGYAVGGAAAGPAAGGAVVNAAGAAARVYAGFWLRLVAAIIDGLLLGIPFGIIVFTTIISAVPGLTHTQDPMTILLLVLPRIMFIALLVLAASWLYFALMESSTWQATLGKKALGLYVTDLQGSRVTFGKASGRFFAGRGISFVPSIGGLYFLIDCIMAGFTDKKQALHDIIAGCLVRRAE